MNEEQNAEIAAEDVVPEVAPAATEQAQADAAEPAPVPTVKTWAEAKGHIPDPKQLQFHRGPNVKVVMVHNKLAINSPISEADYDKAVEAAYAIPIR